MFQHSVDVSRIIYAITPIDLFSKFSSSFPTFALPLHLICLSSSLRDEKLNNLTPVPFLLLLQCNIEWSVSMNCADCVYLRASLLSQNK